MSRIIGAAFPKWSLRAVPQARGAEYQAGRRDQDDKRAFKSFCR